MLSSMHRVLWEYRTARVAYRNGKRLDQKRLPKRGDDKNDNKIVDLI